MEDRLSSDEDEFQEERSGMCIRCPSRPKSLPVAWNNTCSFPTTLQSDFCHDDVLAVKSIKVLDETYVSLEALKDENFNNKNNEDDETDDIDDKKDRRHRLSKSCIAQ